MILGVSVYPDLSPIESIEAYLQLASSHGFSRVFSSMFSMQGTNDEIIAYFRRLIEAAHSHGMEVSLDVNPRFIAKMGGNYNDLSLFHDIGCDILRLDMSYCKERDLVACNNPYGIKIQLNASMGIAKELAYLHEHGVTPDQLLLGHNFYPQRYTGLKWKDFQETNEYLSQYGYSIEAFVSSNAPDTHGVWDAVDGLPTVERMRDYPIDLQARLLDATDNIDGIFIGNAYATEKELQDLQDCFTAPRDITKSPLYEVLSTFGAKIEQPKKEKKIKVKTVPGITDEERYFLFEVYPQTDYGDSSEWIWRSRAGRFINQGYALPARTYEQETFCAGDVVIVNDAYRHYAGEIQIARLPIRNDGKRNLVGRISPQEMEMLELIKNGDYLEFVEE